jgi:hypothetical protein
MIMDNKWDTAIIVVDSIHFLMLLGLLGAMVLFVYKDFNKTH